MGRRLVPEKSLLIFFLAKKGSFDFGWVHDYVWEPRAAQEVKDRCMLHARCTSYTPRKLVGKPLRVSLVFSSLTARIYQRTWLML
jgi:hypothetical protein